MARKMENFLLYSTISLKTALASLLLNVSRAEYRNIVF